jgi:hypothetical protein
MESRIIEGDVWLRYIEKEKTTRFDVNGELIKQPHKIAGERNSVSIKGAFFVKCFAFSLFRACIAMISSRSGDIIDSL